MSFASEYQKLRKKRLEEEEKPISRTTTSTTRNTTKSSSNKPSNGSFTDEYLALREKRMTELEDRSEDIAPILLGTKLNYFTGERETFEMPKRFVDNSNMMNYATGIPTEQRQSIYEANKKRLAEIDAKLAKKPSVKDSFWSTDNPIGWVADKWFSESTKKLQDERDSLAESNAQYEKYGNAVDLSYDELKAKEKEAEKSGDNDAKLYYLSLANQKHYQAVAEKLSKVKMDDEDTSVLEAMNELAQMEDGDKKDARVKKVKAKLKKEGYNYDDYYSPITGDSNITFGNFMDWLGNSAMAGLNRWNVGITDTVDTILGGLSRAVGWKDEPFSKIADYYSDSYSNYSFNKDYYANRMGNGTGLTYGGQFVEGTVAAIPELVAAIMTMGGSLEATMSQKGLSTAAAYNTGNKLTKASITVQNMMKNPQYWTSFASTYGTDFKKAKESGADDATAYFGAMITSLVNSGIEIGLDGQSGIQGLTQDIISGKTSKLYSWIESSLEEGGEEVMQGFVNNAVSKVLYDSSTELANPKEMLTEFGMGTAVGMALGGGTNVVNSTVNYANKAYTEKLTDAEQAVVNKEVENRVKAKEEKKGKELTKKEKADIEAVVVEELKGGGISTDTIEEVLGGDTYKQYKTASGQRESLVNKKAELEKELAELKDKPNTIGNAKRYDAIEGNIEDINAKINNLDKYPVINNLKSQLSQEMTNVINSEKDSLAKAHRNRNSYLSESYNDIERRKEAFKVDLNKYTEKRRVAVERALKSGVLNNGYHTHKFVDMLSKLEEDKGIIFDYTNNKRLQESGLVFKGQVINGFANKSTGSVTINMQGNKVWETTVGHEITHILEGTKAYDVLRETLFTYAESKGELKSRRDALTELYKDKDADIDEELTADLVGEYLFTDSNFIKKLTGDMPTFQRIYDEIKYFCKIATGRELTEIEKVRHEFEKALKEYSATKDAQEVDENEVSGAEIDDVKLSISEDSKKTDAVYLKVAESGNTEIVQKMVDDAANKAGYTIKAYHGTGYDFTVFDKSKQGDNYQDWGRLGKGFYFAPTSREAETWAELSKGEKNKVMPVYLRSENMLDSFEALPDNLKDTIPENWDSLTRRLAEKYAYNYIEYMQEFGYNVQKILTEKGYDGINGHTEFVVFDPEQVKSADAITYDDKGGVIPLSERFNTANEDIRYSVSEDALENIGKILYNDNNPLSIVNRASTNNNSSIKWVYKAEIFSFAENKLFHEKISEINQGKHSFTKNTIDEYMLPIENKIVFTDGNYDSPYVREIIEVLTDSQTEFERIKERIFNVEKGKSSKQDAVRTIRQMFGDGIVISYRSRNDGVYGWEDGRRKGKTRRTAIRNYLNKLYRRRNDSQSNKTKADLNNGSASFMPEDIAPIKYSLSADSEGNQLSKEQIEHFKDSKVRDDNGNLLAVYHGSKDVGFNIFEYSPLKQTGTDFGEAYYFTSDYEKASGYSYDVTKDARVKKYQEERRKHLDKFLETKSEADKQAFQNVKVEGKNLHELMNDESYTTGGEVKKVYLNLTNPLMVDAGGKYYYEVYEQYFKEARESGKDGIIVKNVIDNPRGEQRPIDVYIAFKNNQIKSVANTKPTADADIRYSLSEATDTEYMSAVTKGDTSAAQRIVEETAKNLGYTIRAYHGTARGDRVGNVFLPERATSGPMAFFTSDKQIAENYARDKKDTSLAYDEEYNDYFTQFRVQKNGESISITDLWNTLSYAEKAKIKEKAPHITLDENSENIIYNPNNKYGLGAFDAYRINENNGNYLRALVDEWLVDGNLWGEEHRFIEVLELAGLENVEYRDPDAKHERVYDTFLKISNPFDTANANEEFIVALESWYDAQDHSKYEAESNQADLWDKNNRDAYDFADRLRDDLENGKSFAWTSIPDAVTDFLKSKGYDGIKDTGGKSGGDEHIVYIPFSSEQIKSAEAITYDDKGNVIPLSERFNADNVDIRYSLSKEGEQPSTIGTPLSDLYYEGIAPVKETAPTRVDIPKAENIKETSFADDIAPMTEEEASTLQDELFNSITDVDAPPEVETVYDSMPDTTAIDDKTLKNIGKSLRDTLSLTAEETKAIQEVVQEYSTSEQPSKEELFDKIKDRFGEKAWKEKNEELANIKRYLKSVKIKVSPKIKSEIADFSDFRKNIGWNVSISNEGIPVDVVYKELAEIYPDYFSEDIWNDTDQFLRIAEVAKTQVYMQETHQLDDDAIQQAINIISREVGGYKQNLAKTLAEETAREALDSIAPIRATQLTDGTRDKALLNQSLDNYPMETVEQKVAEKLRAVEGELADNKQLRSEAEANYNSQIEKLAEEYFAKKDKNTKVANNIVRRISKLERLKASVDADFAKRISDLEARAERMKDPKYSRAMYKQAKMQEHAKWAEDLIGDTTNWKDKKIGLQYATNTERRNLRDIVRDENGNVDIARADMIDDALNGRYNREEAAKKRELSQVRGKYADLKINSKESAYIQMLGELRGNPETTLTEKAVNEYYEQHKNKIDKAKVEKALEYARQDYDNLINRVNEKLREQGMKEIPYRQGYFPHFTEPKQNFIQKLLNWKVQDNEIPTSIAGLTETFKPVKSWQSFDKTRHSDTTDYDFLKGFDNYSQGALDWIYHLDTLQKRRAVENHIRFTHSDEGIQARIKEVYTNEELDANEAQAQIEHILAEAKNPLNNFIQDFTTHTNILAGKKNSLDRTVEQWSNRHIYSVMTNVQNRMSANMVLANVRSALTNFIPITQSWAQVSPIRSLQATKDTIANAIKDDGMINKSTFLTNRLREADNLYKTNWDKVMDKAGIMFEIVDSFSSQVIWRSKYNQNIANGMSESQAIQNADQFAENVMAGRSKGNEPTLFNAKNPFVKAFTMFQLEVNNQYGYLFKDVPNDLKAETNHWKLNLAKGYTTAFIGAYIYNALLEQVAGSGAALDPISIIEDLLRDLGLFDDDEEKEPDEVVTNLVDNVVEELPFVGGLFGGGRIPISSALPYSDDGLTGAIEDISEGNWANVGKEMMNPLLNVGLPVGGGQIKKTVQGLKMFDTNEEHPIAGSYTDSGSLRFPVEDTLGNRIQAGIFGQYASKNAREYFDGGYAPLKEKQIQEYMDVDMPIKEYWEYREGLKGLKTVEEKFDYIDSLDLPLAKKNILANNVTDRKEAVDLESYDDFSSLEEFDYATKNPEKYAVAKAVGGYSAYRSYSDEMYDIKADKDENGKSISGSRKEKVIDYINNLDADYYEKIILLKSEYPADDTYNEDIINYINNREDLTYDERVAIFTELGFTVQGDTVYWD